MVVVQLGVGDSCSRAAQRSSRESGFSRSCRRPTREEFSAALGAVACTLGARRTPSQAAGRRGGGFSLSVRRDKSTRASIPHGGTGAARRRTCPASMGEGRDVSSQYGEGRDVSSQYGGKGGRGGGRACQESRASTPIRDTSTTRCPHKCVTFVNSIFISFQTRPARPPVTPPPVAPRAPAPAAADVRARLGVERVGFAGGGSATGPASGLAAAAPGPASGGRAPAASGGRAGESSAAAPGPCPARSVSD